MKLRISPQPSMAECPAEIVAKRQYFFPPRENSWVSRGTFQKLGRFHHLLSMNDTAFVTQAVPTQHWYWKISLPFLHAKLSLVTWSSMELSEGEEVRKCSAEQQTWGAGASPYNLSWGGGWDSPPQFQHAATHAHHPLPVPGHHLSWRMLAWERCHSLVLVQMSQHTGEENELQRQGDFRRSLNSGQQRQGQHLSLLSSAMGPFAPTICVPMSLIPVTHALLVSYWLEKWNKTKCKCLLRLFVKWKEMGTIPICSTPYVIKEMQIKSRI